MQTYYAIVRVIPRYFPIIRDWIKKRRPLTAPIYYVFIFRIHLNNNFNACETVKLTIAAMKASMAVLYISADLTCRKMVSNVPPAVPIIVCVSGVTLVSMALVLYRYFFTSILTRGYLANRRGNPSRNGKIAGYF